MYENAIDYLLNWDVSPGFNTVRPNVFDMVDHLTWEKYVKLYEKVYGENYKIPQFNHNRNHVTELVKLPFKHQLLLGTVSSINSLIPKLFPIACVEEYQRLLDYHLTNIRKRVSPAPIENCTVINIDKPDDPRVVYAKIPLSISMEVGEGIQELNTNHLYFITLVEQTPFSLFSKTGSFVRYSVLPAF